VAPGKGWLDWLLSKERRRGRRRENAPLVVYYWDGASPASHPVRDASPTGIYLLTEHRWYPGTVLALTLQLTEVEHDDPERAITVNARVVRADDTGVGLEFILPGKDQQMPPNMPAAAIDKAKFDRFFGRIESKDKK